MMPNAKALQAKEAMVAELADQMREAVSGVLVDYRGITVAADTQLRTELRKNGVKYGVYKNTLLLRAAKKVGLDSLESVLHGTTALATSGDLVAAAKVLYEYAKRSDGKFKIKAGFVEGNVVGESDVQNLAELPPREQLVARALAGFNAPITGFVNVLNGNLRGLVVALNAIAGQKSA